MGTIIKESNEKPLFELKDSFEDKNIYQRVIKLQGRSKNEIKKIVNRLPTATIHLFSEEEFEKLKAIEMELNSRITIVKDRTTLKDIFFKFLEI